MPWHGDGERQLENVDTGKILTELSRGQLRLVLAGGLAGAVLLGASLLVSFTGDGGMSLPRMTIPSPLPSFRPPAPPGSLPSDQPGGVPTDLPTGVPTELPSGFPTDLPTGLPTELPSGYPTDLPGMPSLPADVPPGTGSGS